MREFKKAGIFMSTPNNETLQTIEKLYKQRGWTIYKLAKESGIPYSSLNNMFLRNTQPSLNTLERLCSGLGISMSDFFHDDILETNVYALDSSEIFIVETYRSLDSRRKELLTAYLSGLAGLAVEPEKQP